MKTDCILIGISDSFFLSANFPAAAMNYVGLKKRVKPTDVQEIPEVREEAAALFWVNSIFLHELAVFQRQCTSSRVWFVLLIPIKNAAHFEVEEMELNNRRRKTSSSSPCQLKNPSKDCLSLA